MKKSTVFLRTAVAFVCFFLLCMNSGYTFSPEESNDSAKIEGVWSGTLNADGILLKIIFKIKKNKDGLWSATMDSPNEGVNNIAIKKVGFEKGVLNLDIESIGGVFKGKVKQIENEWVIKGKWMQSGRMFPLDLKPMGDEPESPVVAAPKEKVEIKVDPKIFDQYVGVYECTPEKIMTISKENDRLFAEASGNPRAEIYPEDENKFFLKVIDGDITFVKDEKQQISHLIFRQGQLQMMAKKINSESIQPNK